MKKRTMCNPWSNIYSYPYPVMIQLIYVLFQLFVSLIASFYPIQLIHFSCYTILGIYSMSIDWKSFLDYYFLNLRTFSLGGFFWKYLRLEVSLKKSDTKNRFNEVHNTGNSLKWIEKENDWVYVICGRKSI